MKKSTSSSRAETKLQELVAAAERLGAVVRIEPLRAGTKTFGGLCRIRGTWHILVDRRLSPKERVAVVSREIERLRGRLATDSRVSAPAP